MAKRTELPDVAKDPDLNRLITSVLEEAKSPEDGIRQRHRGGRREGADHRYINSQIDRTVEQLRAFFPEQYAGGNVHGGGNVTAWPDRVGA
jgi:hypothetical protein